MINRFVKIVMLSCMSLGLSLFLVSCGDDKDSDSKNPNGKNTEENEANNVIAKITSGELLNIGCFQARDGDDGIKMCFSVVDGKLLVDRTEFEYVSNESQDLKTKVVESYEMSGLYAYTNSTNIENVYKVKLVEKSAKVTVYTEAIATEWSTKNKFQISDWVAEAERDVTGKIKNPGESTEPYMSVGKIESHFIKIVDKTHIMMVDVDEDTRTVQETAEIIEFAG